eukprot:12358035-Alexandrium_andersonii.AAC.1
MHVVGNRAQTCKGTASTDKARDRDIPRQCRDRDCAGDRTQQKPQRRGAEQRHADTHTCTGT